MKLLQVHTFYEGYLKEFSARHPELEVASHEAAMRTLHADGFAACHMLAPHLASGEIDARLLVANYAEGQAAWRREHLVKPKVRSVDLLRQQIADFDPDVLYLSDPVTYDSAFVRTLGKRPALVVGWRAAPVLPTTDWSEFDLMISSQDPTLQLALKLGAKAVERFYPGFPSFLAEAVKDEVETSDVVFCGQWTTDHALRNRYWLDLAKATLSQPRDFQLDYYLLAQAPECLPAAVAMFDHGPRFGLEMHRALKRGRICLNGVIDMGQGMSANMRLFEISGTGAFQLMEYHDDISRYFEPGVEIETYRNKNEIVEKIFHYLDHPDERRAVAKKGQERCLRDYSMERRIPWFQELIRKHLQLSQQRHQASQPKADAPRKVASKRPEDVLRQTTKRLAKTEAQLAEIKGTVAWKALRVFFSLEKKVRRLFQRKNGESPGRQEK